jgi:hypothetical protein
MMRLNYKANWHLAKFVSAGSQPTREPRALPEGEIYSLHIRVRAFAVFGDEAVDPRSDNGQRY